ncbi:unnamed protein product, partial [Mesorhabditis belari]|uniref:Uncharacterized protein n=1 Tax=Mesorhabditis belari TaxID=2138241 RepID=A0AAF3FIH2_9BILA
MESTKEGSDLRFIEPQTVVHYTRDGVLSARNAANQDDSNDNKDSSNLSTGVSGYSPRQLGANLSSIASSHPSSNENTAKIQKLHSAIHHLDLARTPHPCNRIRAMAGSDLGNQSINEREIESLDVNQFPFSSTSSSPSYSRPTASLPAHSSEKSSCPL